jgi:hypothetical protein
MTCPRGADSDLHRWTTLLRRGCVALTPLDRLPGLPLMTLCRHSRGPLYPYLRGAAYSVIQTLSGWPVSGPVHLVLLGTSYSGDAKPSNNFRRIVTQNSHAKLCVLFFTKTRSAKKLSTMLCGYVDNPRRGERSVRRVRPAVPKSSCRIALGKNVIVDIDQSKICVKIVVLVGCVFCVSDCIRQPVIFFPRCHYISSCRVARLAAARVLPFMQRRVERRHLELWLGRYFEEFRAQSF